MRQGAVRFLHETKCLSDLRAQQFHTLQMSLISRNANLLLTEGEGVLGNIGPRSWQHLVRTKTTEGQYSSLVRSRASEVSKFFYYMASFL